MTRSIFNDNRGVSEIVASLVILLIVSVAGAALYSYSLSAFSSSNDSFQLQIDQREEQDQERFSIIAVWWDKANQLNVTILNYGEIDLAIDVVYVDGTQVTTYTSGDGETMAKGSIVSVKFTSPVPILDGQTFEIIVVSERGSRNAISWKA